MVRHLLFIGVPAAGSACPALPLMSLIALFRGAHMRVLNHWLPLAPATCASLLAAAVQAQKRVHPEPPKAHGQAGAREVPGWTGRYVSCSSRLAFACLSCCAAVVDTLPVAPAPVRFRDLLVAELACVLPTVSLVRPQ